MQINDQNQAHEVTKALALRNLLLRNGKAIIDY